jgi:putative membrane protein
LLWGLVVVEAFSLVGFAYFVRNPENLLKWPLAAEYFPRSYEFFAQAQIVIAFLALAAFLWNHVRGRALLAFITCVSVSLAAELAGTTYGLPFGAYEYSGLLGPKVAGKVPYLVPLGWFLMALPSYALVARRFHGVLGFFPRVVFASVLLVAWDLTLDPAMSYLTPFWVWAEEGDFFGMPWLNFVGWFVTAVAIMVFFEAFAVRRWTSELPAGFLVLFYLANLALPLGFVVLAGLWQPVALTVGLLCLVAAAVLVLGQDESPSARLVTGHL